HPDDPHGGPAARPGLACRPPIPGPRLAAPDAEDGGTGPMSQSPPPSGFPRSVRIMYIAGIVILVCVGLYFLFLAVDGLGREVQTGTGRLLGLEYREAGQTYTTEIINNRPYVRPQARPEVYLLKLDINGRQTAGAVPKALYEGVRPGDEVQVTYVKRRITGLLQVLEVSR